MTKFTVTDHLGKKLTCEAKLVNALGRSVTAQSAEAREIITTTLNELLGIEHGFYFKTDGTLRYKSGKDKNSKKGVYSAEQSAIRDGVKEVMNSKKYRIYAFTQKSDSNTQINFIGKVMAKDNNNQYIMEEGKPKLIDGIVETFEVTRDEGSSGGGQFITSPKHKNAHLYVYPEIAKKSTYPSVDEKRYRFDSVSPVTIHELLDHGLDFVRTGNNKNSSGKEQKNVQYQNYALKILKKQQRASHTP